MRCKNECCIKCSAGKSIYENVKTKTKTKLTKRWIHVKILLRLRINEIKLDHSQMTCVDKT